MIKDFQERNQSFSGISTVNVEELFFNLIFYVIKPKIESGIH
jgi:hypothetical protein